MPQSYVKLTDILLFRVLLLACALPQILSKLSLHPKMVPFEYGTLMVWYIFLPPAPILLDSYVISVHSISLTWHLFPGSHHATIYFKYILIYPIVLSSSWWILCLHGRNDHKSMSFIMHFSTKFGPKIFPFRNLQYFTYPLVKYPNRNIQYVGYSSQSYHFPGFISFL